MFTYNATTYCMSTLLACMYIYIYVYTCMCIGTLVGSLVGSGSEMWGVRRRAGIKLFFLCYVRTCMYSVHMNMS